MQTGSKVQILLRQRQLAMATYMSIDGYDCMDPLNVHSVNMIVVSKQPMPKTNG